ncbi:MAG: beta-ketoacyl-[acyl-carrier-protein] synthase family protein [Acidobacteriota bacterium]
MRRIVITGLGTLTPLGLETETVWQRLLAGQCGISPVRSFDTASYFSASNPSGSNVYLGGEVHDFEPETDLENLDPASMGRASQLAVAAARRAFADSALDASSLEPWRCGVAMGTTSGEPREVEHYNDLRAAGDLGPVAGELANRYPCHVIAGQVAAELGFAGPNSMIPAACAAGNYALARAFDALRAGRTDVMLAGGADAFSRITYTGFARLGAIAPEMCQPFDRNRRGMVPGEGAAVLVLETLERALERGAPRIYAEVAGYGLSCDAHHMTAALPDGSGAARAMVAAMRHAGVTPDDIDYVSAHGTGTPTNDTLETRALEHAFGSSARRKPVSSIKSMIGHTMGAASAIEAAVCALTLSEGFVPPTINFTEPDPDCAVDCVPNEARELAARVVMNNASAFGGNNASVIFRRCEP